MTEDTTSYVYANTSSTTTTYVAWPEGRRVYRKVKAFVTVYGNDGDSDEGYHPNLPHRWHEMLHYGKRGTGFATCSRCGAIGAIYGRDQRREPKARRDPAD